MTDYSKKAHMLKLIHKPSHPRETLASKATRAQPLAIPHILSKTLSLNVYKPQEATLSAAEPASKKGQDEKPIRESNTVSGASTKEPSKTNANCNVYEYVIF